MLLPILTLAPSVARTTAGTGDWLDLVALAAISGTATPTLTVFIEDSVDGNPSNANSVGVTTGITATGRTVLTLGPRGDAYPANFVWPFNATRCRARWTITGTTPSFTFNVKGVLI